MRTGDLPKKDFRRRQHYESGYHRGGVSNRIQTADVTCTGAPPPLVETPVLVLSGFHGPHGLWIGSAPSIRSRVNAVLASHWLILVLSIFVLHFRLGPLLINKDRTRCPRTPRCGRLREARTGNIRTHFVVGSQFGSKMRYSGYTLSSSWHSAAPHTSSPPPAPHPPTFARKKPLSPLAHSSMMHYHCHWTPSSVPFRSTRGG